MLRPLALVVLCATHALAVPVLPPLASPTKASVTRVLTNGGWFSVAESAYRFSSNGTVEATGIYAAEGKGTWSLNGDVLRATGKGYVAMCDDSADPRRDCPWNFELEWRVRSVGKDALVVEAITDTVEQISIPEEPVLLTCHQGASRRECNNHHDFSYALIPAAADRSLFEQTRKLLEGWNGKSTLVFEGAPAKTPRVTSEIFYAPDQKSRADELAGSLAPVLGPIVPQPWPVVEDEPSPFFLVRVVVGAKKADGKAVTPTPSAAPSGVRVAFSDGKCVTSAACKNALTPLLKAALPAGFQVLSESQAKKPHADTEVWFRKGFEAQARALAAKELSKWVKPENVKPWTWGGDFDVLIVVGGGE